MDAVAGRKTGGAPPKPRATIPLSVALSVLGLQFALPQGVAASHCVCSCGADKLNRRSPRVAWEKHAESSLVGERTSPIQRPTPGLWIGATASRPLQTRTPG